MVGGSSADSASLDVDDGSGLRTSKSDTSLTDSFVVVPEARKRTINPLNVLRSGMCDFNTCLNCVTGFLKILIQVLSGKDSWYFVAN